MNDFSPLNFYSAARLTRQVLAFTFLLISVLAMPSIGHAQPDETAQEPAKLSFNELSKTIRENEREINRLYSTIPVGFPAREKQYLDRIDVLTATNIDLRQRFDEVALSSFKNAPAENPEAARLIFKSLSAKLDPANINSHFDPAGAQALGLVMVNAELAPEQWPSGISYPNLLYQVFRASFAIEDFEQADELLKRIESLEFPLKPEIREQLEDAKKRWEREGLIRRFETNTDDMPRVKLETTEGEIIVELFENHAPQTVGNFIALVERNFYNDMNFFVAKPGEYAVTGCTKNDGTGDAGYRIANELDREQLRDHFSGTLTMFNDEQGTAGSQFMITHQRNPKFDGKFTAFGRVLKGMDVVLKLRSVNMINSPTAEASKITKASVIRKRDHEYAATPIQE